MDPASGNVASVCLLGHQYIFQIIGLDRFCQVLYKYVLICVASVCLLGHQYIFQIIGLDRFCQVLYKYVLICGWTYSSISYKGGIRNKCCDDWGAYRQYCCSCIELVQRK